MRTRIVAAITLSSSIACWIGGYWVGRSQTNSLSRVEAKEDSKVSGRVPEERSASPRVARTEKGIREIIDASEDQSRRRQNVDELFKEAANVASSNGDFGYLKALFEAVSQEEKSLLLDSLSSTFSKLGPAHDLKEKLSILETVNSNKESLKAMRRRFLEMEARERYDQLKEEGLLDEMDSRDFSTVCLSLAKSRMHKGFSAVEDSKDEGTKRAAAAEVAKYAMAAGTLEASEEIKKMAPGMVRDEAVAEMVIWLSQTGSRSEAEPWLETIEDKQAFARASKVLSERKPGGR